MENFYTTTNRITRKVENSRGATEITLQNKYLGLNLDARQIEWYNVTSFETDILMASVLLVLLAKLPLVWFVEAGGLTRNGYEVVNIRHASRVKELDIEKFVDDAIQFIFIFSKPAQPHYMSPVAS